MPKKSTVEMRILKRIKSSRSAVFLTKDFKDAGSSAQIGRVLRRLVQKGEIISIGYGVYCRAKQSSISGNPVPEKTLQELAKELMNRFDVKTVPSSAEQAYNSGRSPQVPTGRVIGVNKRVTRKIGYDGKYISFEKVT